jgi:hypothetical protein
MRTPETYKAAVRRMLHNTAIHGDMHNLIIDFMSDAKIQAQVNLQRKRLIRLYRMVFDGAVIAMSSALIYRAYTYASQAIEEQITEDQGNKTYVDKRIIIGRAITIPGAVFILGRVASSELIRDAAMIAGGDQRFILRALVPLVVLCTTTVVGINILKETADAMLPVAMERTTPPKGGGALILMVGAVSIVSTSLVIGAAELVKIDQAALAVVIVNTAAFIDANRILRDSIIAAAGIITINVGSGFILAVARGHIIIDYDAIGCINILIRSLALIVPGFIVSSNALLNINAAMEGFDKIQRDNIFKFDIDDLVIKDITPLAILPLAVIIGVVGILCPANLIFDDEAALEFAVMIASVAIVGSVALIDFDEGIAHATSLYKAAVVI